MEVGIRVVRGPHWSWSTQDGGEGFVGTVVEVGRESSTSTPEKTVVVQWDLGNRTNYRVGYQGCYDLRIYDLAPIGVRHGNIACHGCGTHPIAGIRWSCNTCRNIDLCQICYMNDVHDVAHNFLRYDSMQSKGFLLSKRSDCQKFSVHGIFRGATVARGPDWDWGNQDGGPENRGLVLDVRGWDNESERSVVNVAWQSGITNVYRLGHKGKVDMRCIEPASNGSYYRKHLPVLGTEYHVPELSALNTDGTIFKVGDRVRVNCDVDTLKHLQTDHGGWNPKMSQYMETVGSVHRITDKGDVRVQFDGCSNRWTFFAGALTKLDSFSVGDVVKVCHDHSRIGELRQKYSGRIVELLTKGVRVRQVRKDGDVVVSVESADIKINPSFLTLCPEADKTKLDNSNAHDRPRSKREQVSGAIDESLSTLMETCSLETTRSHLVKAAAKGHEEVVREILSSKPELVNEKSAGKTSLQVACHQGYLAIVSCLIAHGADLELKDDEGDTALHYAVFGNQPNIVRLLLEKKADCNPVNKSRCTPLHVAVSKSHDACVKHLVAANCDVNILDSYGDTALHDAISKNNQTVIDLLLSLKFDPTVKTSKGFNALHYAALKGNLYVLTRLLERHNYLVNSYKSDGFTALHLASLNGHYPIVSHLIDAAKADIDCKTGSGETPLLLAVSQAHPHVVELLVRRGASLSCVDSKGDSVLHMAVSELVLFSSMSKQTLPKAPSIAQISSQLVSAGLEQLPGLAIACYLLQKGANPKLKNAQKCTPLDALSSIGQVQENKTHVLQILQRYTKTKSGDSGSRSGTKRRESSSADKSSSSKARAPKTAINCMVCEETFACVTFQPCGHTVACVDCCKRMKSCLRCDARIAQKLGPDKMPVETLQNKDQVDQLRLQMLEKQLQQLEDTVNCSICMERKKTVVFLCGHSTCRECARPLKICHICRKPISKRINMYES